MNPVNTVIFLILLCPISWRMGCAQSPATPFSKMQIKVAIGQSTSSGAYSKLWESRFSGSADIAMPFYAGWASGGVHIETHASKSGGLPDYRSYFGRMGWHYEFSGTKGVRYDSGIRFGLMFMNFEGAASRGTRNESEVAFSLFQNVKIPMSNRIGLVLEFDYTSVFTRRPLHFYYLRLGFSVDTKTPAWLNTVLE